jgi:hypothetical protein
MGRDWVKYLNRLSSAAQVYKPIRLEHCFGICDFPLADIEIVPQGTRLRQKRGSVKGHMSDSQLTANAKSLCNDELSSLESTGPGVMHRVVFEITTAAQWYDILHDAIGEFGPQGFRSQKRVLRKLKMSRMKRMTNAINTTFRHNNHKIFYRLDGVAVWFDVPSLPWVFKILLKHGLNHKFVDR